MQGPSARLTAERHERERRARKLILRSRGGAGGAVLTIIIGIVKTLMAGQKAA
jgi:predicted anti-sigma-YlaC factor YlaD